MGIIAGAMMIGGALSGGVSAYYSAESQRSALRAQAGIAETNARISETAAQGELVKGEKESAAILAKGAQVKGAQRAAMAANGVDLSADGSTAEVLTSTDINSEADAATVNQDAVRSAWGYRMEAVNYKNEAILKRATANGINPTMAAVTSLLGSASQISSAYYLKSGKGK